jgi:hypothetical protein
VSTLLLLVGIGAFVSSLFLLWRRVTEQPGTAAVATVLSLGVVIVLAVVLNGVVQGSVF